MQWQQEQQQGSSHVGEVWLDNLRSFLNNGGDMPGNKMHSDFIIFIG
jgi:hypothetical protein